MSAQNKSIDLSHKYEPQNNISSDYRLAVRCSDRQKTPIYTENINPPGIVKRNPGGIFVFRYGRKQKHRSLYEIHEDDVEAVAVNGKDILAGDGSGFAER